MKRYATDGYYPFEDDEGKYVEWVDVQAMLRDIKGGLARGVVDAEAGRDVRWRDVEAVLRRIEKELK